MSKRNVRGFTLIELVIVIAVIAILAALLVPTILGQAERARASRARSDVANIGKAIARLRTDTGNSSSNALTDITTNLTKPDTTSTNGVGTLGSCTTATPGYICWGGPYMPTVTNDPWNQPYTVTVDTNTFAVTVFSNGPDQTSNTSDDVTFIQ